nr:MAG TPA: hypothetical protein [Caudoviricetes sp.]
MSICCAIRSAPSTIRTCPSSIDKSPEEIFIIKSYPICPSSLRLPRCAAAVTRMRMMHERNSIDDKIATADGKGRSADVTGQSARIEAQHRTTVKQAGIAAVCRTCSCPAVKSRNADRIIYGMLTSIVAVSAREEIIKIVLAEYKQATVTGNNRERHACAAARPGREYNRHIVDNGIWEAAPIVRFKVTERLNGCPISPCIIRFDGTWNRCMNVVDLSADHCSDGILDFVFTLIHRPPALLSVQIRLSTYHQYLLYASLFQHGTSR